MRSRYLAIAALLATAVDASAAPCFADVEVLAARKIHADLEAHALVFGAGSEVPPDESYGTCKVSRGEIRDRSGVLVAELACGITVHVKGIADDRGFQIGASGRDIAKTHAKDRATCRNESEGRVRCWFDPQDGAASEHYLFRGTLPGATVHQPARGTRARNFVRARRVVQVVQRMHCH